MTYEFDIALSLMKTMKERFFFNFNVSLSILGIIVGVAFLIFALSVYDGYVKRIETIIFSIYPQITLQNDTNPNDEVDWSILDEEEGNVCDEICSGKIILKQPEENLSLNNFTGTPFDLKQYLTVETRLKGKDNILHVSPVIFEEKHFTYHYFKENEKVTAISKLRVLGVASKDGQHFVPEIERIVHEPSLLKLLSTNEPVGLISIELYEDLFGYVPLAQEKINKRLFFQIGNENLELQIVGIFRLGVHNIAKNMIITPLAAAQQLFDLKNGASFLGVSLNAPYEAKQTYQELEEILAEQNILVFNWLTVADDLFNSLSFYRKIVIITLFMSILITAFNIYNNLTLMILERKSLIGILMSMGVKKSALYKIFLIISQFEAFIGVAIGLLIGGIGGYAFSHYLNQTLAEFLPVQDASVAIDAISIVGIMIFVGIVCAVTAYISARKAANLDVVQCLQSE
jgi:ABC-type lipoprotein release transport system permease subunit